MRKRKKIVLMAAGIGIGFSFLFGMNRTKAATDVTTITVADVSELKTALTTASEHASENQPYEIVVSSGKYDLSSTLHVSSYTSLKCEKDAIFTCRGSYAAAIGENSNNAKINGGIWNGSEIKVEDGASNFTVENATIQDATHGVLIQSCKGNSIIQKNTIKNSGTYGIYVLGGDVCVDIVGNNITKTNLSGIMLTNTSYEGKIANNTISDVAAAYSMRINASKVKGSITSNTILNSSDVAFWINDSNISGNISKNTLDKGKKTGLYFTRTAMEGDVTKNTIKNMKGNGIGVYHGSHCGSVNENIISNIGGDRAGNHGDYGIVVSALDTKNTYVKEIKKNKISNVTYCGICIYAGLSSKNKPLTNYSSVKKNIEGNTLYKCGTYVCSLDWKKEIASGGKRGSRAGIYVDHYAQVYGDICNNSVKKSEENGIYLHLGGKAGNIYNNTVSECKVDGIQLYDVCTAKSIYKNKVSNCGRNGIRLYKSKVTKAIKNNTFSKNKDSGINLVTNSKTKSILSNTIIGRKTLNSHGISIRAGCQAEEIKSNKVSSMDWGIYLESSSKKTEIVGNKLSANTHNIIRVGTNNISPTSKTTVGSVKIKAR